ncbi:MAG: SapC family protein [Alphaproteobacteria bacterium]|nr:SapC family protein [Alphaproteobacteria bacterium]
MGKTRAANRKVTASENPLGKVVKDVAARSAADDQESKSLRQLLRRAEPLDPKRHADFLVKDGRDFSFASNLHTIPLSAVEFMPTARHYPIIFAGEKDIHPVALLGLRSDENLFVEADGRWKEGCYVPAILRRAPFVLMQDIKGGKDGVGLCLDVESPLVSKTEGTPIFVNGKPTAMLAKMANFAASYSKEQARTRVFVNACIASDLLVERQMEITLTSGQKIVFSGFRVIDQDRLRKLDDETALKWFRTGWSALALAHFLSLGNMGRLHHRSNARVSKESQ